jgi:hypothetical protein
MTITEARASIAAATSLSQLMQALRDTRRLDDDDQNEIDWTDLRVFGGKEPDDTSCVWSWDARSLLVGTCADDLNIVGRDA